MNDLCSHKASFKIKTSTEALFKAFHWIEARNTPLMAVYQRLADFYLKIQLVFDKVDYKTKAREKSMQGNWIWIAMQLLKGLKASHATGIVHRDIKPQNVIISETDAKAKLIDLGAAADLRVGINYVPNEYLLDPRYAPPEQYIMSTSTPRAPPVPVAATLSPILWRLNNPDRFDMYSVGVTLIQMVFAPLRNDNALVRLWIKD